MFWSTPYPGPFSSSCNSNGYFWCI
jgi:hypothetical protein